MRGSQPFWFSYVQVVPAFSTPHSFGVTFFIPFGLRPFFILLKIKESNAPWIYPKFKDEWGRAWSTRSDDGRLCMHCWYMKAFDIHFLFYPAHPFFSLLPSTLLVLSCTIMSTWEGGRNVLVCAPARPWQSHGALRARTYFYSQGPRAALCGPLFFGFVKVAAASEGNENIEWFPSYLRIHSSIAWITRST